MTAQKTNQSRQVCLPCNNALISNQRKFSVHQLRLAIYLAKYSVPEVRTACSAGMLRLSTGQNC